MAGTGGADIQCPSRSEANRIAGRIAAGREIDGLLLRRVATLQRTEGGELGGWKGGARCVYVWAGGQEETAIKCETGLPIHHQTWSLGQWSLNVVPFQLFRLSAISLFFYSTTTTSVARYNTRRPETDRYVYTVQYVMDISPPHTHGRRVDVWLNHRRRQRKRREEEEEETGGGRRSARKSPTCQSG